MHFRVNQAKEIRSVARTGDIFNFLGYLYYLSILKLIRIFVITSENNDGAKRTRTADPLHAMQVLYQLSYGPKSQNVIHINHFKDFFRNVLIFYSTLQGLIIDI